MKRRPRQYRLSARLYLAKHVFEFDICFPPKMTNYDAIITRVRRIQVAGIFSMIVTTQ